MEIITKNLTELNPAPYNPREISDEAFEGLSASLQEFGCVEPIIWNKQTGNIAGGHMRLRVLKQNGIEQTQVVVVDLPLEKEKALNLALNNRHIQGDWTPVLADLLAEIQTGNPTLFESLKLFALESEVPELDMEIPDGLTDPDEVPEVTEEEPVIQEGDLITLGAHRLLCGDSTNIDEVTRLIQDQKTDLVFTDPPYNVDYEGGTHEKLKIKNDALSYSDFNRFLNSVFSNYRVIVKDGASLYICHPSRYQREFQNALEQAGFEVRCQLIWAKNTFALSWSRYHFRHEPIFYAHVNGQSDAWYGDRSQTTIWQENKPAANTLHPTTKPVELIERALINSSKPGDIVADFFGGSGSTLIGCERTGRVCRMLELDPRYAQVIVQRYVQYTGRPEEIIVTRAGKKYAWQELQS